MNIDPVVVFYLIIIVLGIVTFILVQPSLKRKRKD